MATDDFLFLLLATTDRFLEFFVNTPGEPWHRLWRDSVFAEHVLEGLGNHLSLSLFMNELNT